MVATPRPKKLKGYVNGNHDGLLMAMVAATSLPEAAKRLHTSPHAMRTYGWFLAEDEDLALVLANPEAIFYRPIMGDRAWTTDRDSLRKR